MNDAACLKSSHRLYSLLIDFLSKHSSSDTIGVLFSGGLDSSVITAILSKVHPRPFQLFVAGIESAKDIKLARIAADALNLPITLCVFTKNDVKEKLPTIMSIGGRVDVLHVELAIPLFFASHVANQFGISTLYSGQGADELFGGYAKHEKLFLESGEQSVLSEMELDFRILHEETLPLMDTIVAHSNIQLVVPFCEKSISEFASSLPFSCKLVQDSDIVIRKRVLRLLAEYLGLPPEVVHAPKRALQYGSGAHRILTNLSADYWIDQNPNMTQREARSHTRVEKYLAQFLNQ